VLSAVFFEPSFPDRLESLEQQTGYLMQRILINDFDKLDKQEVPVKIFHMKPQSLEEFSSVLASC
jgi:hypothetical protein